MAHPIQYGIKTVDITGPIIRLSTDSSLNTNLPPVSLNAGGILSNMSSFSSAQVISVAPTVDTGTVATYQTRGSAATLKNGWLKLRDYWPGSGQVPVAIITIPAIQALTTTGSPTILYPFGVTALISLIYRPTFNQSFPVCLVNNSTTVIGTCNILTTGVVSLTLAVPGTFTAPFGLSSDTTITYQITPVGL
jgi:hypothetical protein